MFRERARKDEVAEWSRRRVERALEVIHRVELGRAQKTRANGGLVGEAVRISRSYNKH